MKFSTLVKTVLASALVAGLTTVSFESPVSAQVETAPDTTDTTVVEDEDDGFDWGLLGLLGLLGLAGLARKSDDRVPAYRDPQTTSTTSTRSDHTNLR